MTALNFNAPHPLSLSPAVFRGFWTVLIILGLVAALTGGFLLVCGVSFLSPKLFKLGGAFLIAAGKSVHAWNSEAQSGRQARLRCSGLLGEHVDTNTFAAAAAVAADSCSYLSYNSALL